jgi:riboflavin synthase
MAMGSIVKRTECGPGLRLSLSADLGESPIVLGESLAVDGCCLSVAAVVPGGFEVDASAETVARTTLGRVAPGRVVNLERALCAGERIGGHLVTGHIDGVAELVGRRGVGDSMAVTFAVPQTLRRFVAEKGSVAVNGVSLTVNSTTGSRFDAMLIPITLAKTNLASLVTGDRVNIEVDLIARYVARLMESGDEALT